MTVYQSISPNVLSAKNSTTIVPTVGTPFIGGTEDVLQFVSITITLGIAGINHSGTLIFEFSPDGYYWDISVGTPVTGSSVFIPRSLRVVNRYFRLKYIPNDSNITAFRLTTTLHIDNLEDITRLLTQEITTSDPIKLHGGVLLAKREDSTSLFAYPHSKAVDGYVGLDVAVINDTTVLLHDGYGRPVDSKIGNPTGFESGLVVRNIPITSSISNMTNVSASITAVTLLAANSLRRGATIFNDSVAGNLKIGLGTTSVSLTNFVVEMVPSSYYEIPFGFTGRISGIWNVASGAARISEIT